MAAQPLTPLLLQRLESTVSAHRGHPWRVASTEDLAERASHPAFIVRDRDGLGVFVKLLTGDRAHEQAEVELAGLAFLGAIPGVEVPRPVSEGLVSVSDGTTVIVLEALPEIPPTARGPREWAAIGRALALLHARTGAEFGFPRDGYFGPLRQPNAPVPGAHWADFYRRRRLVPWLSSAVAAGAITPSQISKVRRVLNRLDALAPDPARPALLHGDAQHHNFLSLPGRAVLIDVSPYFGHPEIDLALLDYFSPVPEAVWDGYREIGSIDPDFATRRELWRLHGYLAVLSVDVSSSFGRAMATRLQGALELVCGTRSG